MNEDGLNCNKLLVRRYYEGVVHTGNVDSIEQFISPHYVEVHDNVRHPLGVDGARAHVLGVHETYPDFRLTVDRQIAEGEYVVTRVTVTGTQATVWLGIQPTGKPLEMVAVNIDRIVDGRIVEHDGAASLLVPLLNAGAIQPAVD